MRNFSFSVLCGVLLGAFSVAALGSGFEFRVGTGPSLSMLATVDVSSQFSVVFAVGAYFPSASQTPSVQTPSWSSPWPRLTVGAGVRWAPVTLDRGVAPYGTVLVEVGRTGGEVGISLQIAGGLGVQVVPRVHLVAEGLLVVPLSAPDRPRLGLLGGIRLRF